MRGGGRGHWYLPATLLDLYKVADVIKSNLPITKPKITITKDPQTINNFLKLTADLQMPCAFDIETSYVKGERITCIGFSAKIDESVVVDLTDNFDWLECVDVINKWMTNPDIKWIAPDRDWETLYK